MNLSNDIPLLSKEFTKGVEYHAWIHVARQFNTFGYCLMLRRTLMDFYNMQLMGAEMNR